MKRLASGAGLAILIAAILFRRPLQQLIKSVPLPARPAFGLSRLNKDELYRRAQEKDIPGRSEMTKDQLIRALQEH